MTRLDPATKDSIFKARDHTARFVGSDHFDGVSEADTGSLRLQVQTLTDQLREANADREVSHQNIHTLTLHLKEANADRELSHQHIQTLRSSQAGERQPGSHSTRSRLVAISKADFLGRSAPSAPKND